MLLFTLQDEKYKVKMTENSLGSEPGLLAPISMELRSYLRSGVAISSFSQAVEELVLNSIDAQAKNIAVRVDLDLFKAEVIDNGIGIKLEDLKLIGSRYVTSKCKTVSDIEEGRLGMSNF